LKKATAERLAKKHKVSKNTIQRDAQFAKAVNKIAEGCWRRDTRSISGTTPNKKSAVFRGFLTIPDDAL
jgi:transcriptional antiterminator